MKAKKVESNYTSSSLEATLCLFVSVVLMGCSNINQSSESNLSGKLFKKIDHTTSGLKFTNTVVQTAKMNYFLNQYALIGSGAAIGGMISAFDNCRPIRVCQLNK